MKNLITIIILAVFTFIAVETSGVTYKSLNIGASICYEYMVPDQLGEKLVPNVGDVVTLTLKRTPESDTNLLVMTGLYIADEDEYNYTFAADSDETDFAAGDAYWYLELINAANKIHLFIDISKIKIKR